jgi:hypothetical protein
MEHSTWWGDFSIQDQEALSWSIGDRCILIQRLASEWNTWNIISEQEITESVITNGWNSSEKPDDKYLGRHLQENTSDYLRIVPALADRSIVARPNVPLKLPSGEKVRIYVSTPIWFKALIKPNDTTLLDIPFWRPSDSWMGSSTMEGELCYAKYTDARLKLELLEQRSHRAVTSVWIHNKRDTALTIERINVPVPLLNLYSDENNLLWSDSISITSESENDMVELKLNKQVPEEAKSGKLVSSPRITDEKHTLLRSISGLFS